MKYIIKYQKIVLIIIISIITLGVAYYAYIMKTNDEFDMEEQNLLIEESKREENSEIKEENTKIVVHVSGAVKSEGIVELDKNSRVADAIEAAGGVSQNAYMKDINLASILEDGMKVYIPTNEEVEKQKENSNYISNANTDIIAKNSQENKTGATKTNSKVNINTATKEELDTLPGIGESTANKIINYRKENGNFKSIDEIKEVSGIGDSKFEQIKDLIEI